jgi:FKBP-type peptidyl-prolyl cis-trans isomerase
VKVHYRSTLLDGSEFTIPSAGKRAGDAARERRDRGMAEGLQLMREGARWQLFIPADLAYGRRGPLADRTVIYEVELISVEPGA